MASEENNQQSSKRTKDDMEHHETNAKLKVGLFKKILKHMQASQNSANSHPKVLRQLKQLYYRQKNPAEAKEYQKYFFSLIWNAMIVPFRETKCAAQERMTKVFTKFALSAGTPSDVEEYGYPIKDLPPLYTFIVRIYRSNHGEIRQLLRLRLIEIIYEILKEKHADCFFENEKVQVNLRKNLLERSQDKHPPIRSIAFKCFTLIDPEKEIVTRLKFHAEFDPHADARKSALTSLVNITPSRPSFVVKKAFDLNEEVRIEAFKALVKVPFKKLKPDQKYKIIQWGLMQPVRLIKKIVTKELLPAWIASCENSVINLLGQLDVSKNASTAALLFRALFPDDSEELFEQMDLSFLDNNTKLVPIGEISLEKMIYWRYTCGKFRNRPYCVQKIIPEAGDIIGYIERLVEKIHKECALAAAENREDEDMESILCLSHVLRIAELCEFEDGSRRKMETLLGNILRDSMLDETVVIYTAVDVAHKVVEKSHFNNFMIEILQGIFEIDVLDLDMAEDVSANSSAVAEMTVNGAREHMSIRLNSTPAVSDAVRVLQNGDSPDQSVESNAENDVPVLQNSVGSGQAVEIKVENDVPVLQNSDSPNQSFETNAENDVPMADKSDVGSQTSTSDRSVDSQNGNAPRSPVLAPLPIVKPKDEIVKLKNERATLIAQRHRLLMKKELAIKSNDFEGAQSAHNEMEAIKEQESMLRNQIDNCDKNENEEIKSPESRRNEDRSLLMSPILHPSLLEVRQSLLRPADNVPEHPSLVRPRLSFAVPVVDRGDSEEIDELQGAVNKTIVSLANSLRGVVMLTRYLTFQNELNLYVRTMYDSHIMTCLEDQDSRLRTYAMYLICIVGMIEKSQAKKSMSVMIQGLTSHEEEVVETASFKGMVDLLLQYDYSVFRATQDDDDYAGDLPHPLNDSSIGNLQMEEFFVKKLSSYALEDDEYTESKTICFSTKVLGFLKLLLRDRIRDENVVSWLLCLWAERKYTGTSVCFNIGYWIPVYTSMGVPHALIIAKAFFKSVKDLLTKEDNGTDEQDCNYDIMKLAHLIISNTSTGTVQTPEGTPTIHEEIALLIINEININIDHPHNVLLAKLLRMLDIQTKFFALQIRKSINEMIQIIAEFTDSAVCTKLKITLTALEIQLTKRFGPLEKTTEDAHSDLDENNDDSIEEMEEADRPEINPSKSVAVPRNSMIFQEGSEIMSTFEAGSLLSLPGSRTSRRRTHGREVSRQHGSDSE